MTLFGNNLFENNRRIRWFLSPFLILFLCGMLFLADCQTPGRILLMTAIQAAGWLLLGVFWLPPTFQRLASRLLTALVFCAYSFYLVTELGREYSPISGPPLGAIAGFIFIGLPCLWYAVLGRFAPNQNKEMNARATSRDVRFDHLVTRLESYAKAHPSRYRFKVLLFAILGYAYIAGILVLLALGLVVLYVFTLKFRHAYVTFKLAVPLLALGYLILKALWVKVTPPEGIPVDNGSAPRLFAEVETIRRSLGSSSVHSILLSDDFNAGVSQIPRFGVFGWTRIYLVIGVPLLMALSPEQFMAVLIHEFGHISGGHGKIGSFIYRIRTTWGRLMQTMEESEHWGAAFFRRFFNWYAPSFGAYSFVLARDQEYEADRVSAQLTSPVTAAAALVALELRGQFMESDFWPRMYDSVKHTAEPPFPFTQLLTESFQTDDATASERLEKAMTRKTGTADTHPALADRLAALCHQPLIAKQSPQSAAVFFLGDNLPEYIARLDATWRRHIESSWQQRHEYLGNARERLQQLQQTAPGERTVAEKREIAFAVELLEDSQAALPLFRELLDTNADDPGSQYAVGRILLKSGDDQGITHINRAMELDRELGLDGCGLVYQHLLTAGKESEAQAYLKLWEQHAETQRLAERERRTVSAGDAVQSHRLPGEAVAKLTEQLSQYREIISAWLAEKKVYYFPGKPLYLLVISAEKPWFRYRPESYYVKLSNRLARELQSPGEAFILVTQISSNKPLWKKVRKIPESQIYSRQTTPSPIRRKSMNG